MLFCTKVRDAQKLLPIQQSLITILNNLRLHIIWWSINESIHPTWSQQETIRTARTYLASYIPLFPLVLLRRGGGSVCLPTLTSPIRPRYANRSQTTATLKQHAPPCSSTLICISVRNYERRNKPPKCILISLSQVVGIKIVNKFMYHTQL